MHVLFNFSKEELNKMYSINESPMNYQNSLKLIHQGNQAFDEDVFEYFYACFNKKSGSNRKKLTLDTYLVDHLK